MQKKLLAEIFCIFECLLPPKNHLIKVLNSPDSFRPNGRLSQNKKKRGFKELALPGNDLKTCSTVNFPKEKYPDFGVLETNHEIQT